MQRAIFEAFDLPEVAPTGKQGVVYLRIERSGEITHAFVDNPFDPFEAAALAAVKQAAPFDPVPDEGDCLTEEQFEVRFTIQTQ